MKIILGHDIVLQEMEGSCWKVLKALLILQEKISEMNLRFIHSFLDLFLVFECRVFQSPTIEGSRGNKTEDLCLMITYIYLRFFCIEYFIVIYLLIVYSCLTLQALLCHSWANSNGIINDFFHISINITSYFSLQRCHDYHMNHILLDLFLAALLLSESWVYLVDFRLCLLFPMIISKNKS